MGYTQDLARLRQQHIMGANPMPMPDDMGNDGMPMPDQIPMPQNDIGGIRSDVNSVASRFGGDKLSPPSDVDPDLQHYQDIVNSLYTPSNTASDRLNELLNHVPERGRTGFGRTLVASGMALGKGGYDAAEKFMNEPHTRAMADWKDQATPFASAATNENQRNVNERLLATNAATNIFTSEKNAKLAQIAEDKNRITEAKNKDTAALAQQRNEIMWAKQNGAKFETKGKNVIGMRPDGTVWDTGVPTTAFSPTELEILKQEGRMDLAGANNAAAMDRTVQQGKNAVEVKITPGAPAAATPANQMKDRANIAEEILARNPDLSSYIKVDKGVITLKPPKATMFGGVPAVIQQKYQQALDAIYGKVGGDIPPIQVPGQKQATQQPAAGQMVKVKNPQGVVGTIPASQLPAAVKQGYTQVK